MRGRVGMGASVRAAAVSLATVGGPVADPVLDWVGTIVVGAKPRWPEAHQAQNDFRMWTRMGADEHRQAAL